MSKFTKFYLMHVDSSFEFLQKQDAHENKSVYVKTSIRDFHVFDDIYHRAVIHAIEEIDNFAKTHSIDFDEKEDIAYSCYWEYEGLYKFLKSLEGAKCECFASDFDFTSHACELLEDVFVHLQRIDRNNK